MQGDQTGEARTATESPGATRLPLPEVTICAADSAFVPLTARALRISAEQCVFGDAILFSHQPADGPFRHVAISALTSLGDYSRFCLTMLGDFIETEYALIVQWDGYVVNPDAWARAFLKYDYIGATWYNLLPSPTVGNGGFSLRSRKLLRALKQLPPIGGYWEDRVICRAYRPALENEFGIRFAPPKVADRFSYEDRVPDSPSFGFHGIQHLWRHIDEAELAPILAGLDLARVHPDKVLELVVQCLRNGRVELARSTYARLKRKYSELVIRRVMAQRFGEIEAGQYMIALEQTA